MAIIEVWGDGVWHTCHVLGAGIPLEFAKPLRRGREVACGSCGQVYRTLGKMELEAR